MLSFKFYSCPRIKNKNGLWKTFSVSFLEVEENVGVPHTCPNSGITAVPPSLWWGSWAVSCLEEQKSKLWLHIPVGQLPRSQRSGGCHSAECWRCLPCWSAKKETHSRWAKASCPSVTTPGTSVSWLKCSSAVKLPWISGHNVSHWRAQIKPEFKQE